MTTQFALLETTPQQLIFISCPATLPVAQLTPIITDYAPPTAHVPIDPMEALWHSQFDQLFGSFWSSFGTYWRLVPKALVGYPVTNWNMHSDAAKVRFLCEVCGHGWTSMKGRVVFWYQLDARGCGTVAFSLFGQKCQQCSRDGFDHFTSAMWYQEEVVKVLYNVFNRVGQTYYGFQRPAYVKNRRPGKPRSQHASELCQACELGVCTASMAAKDFSKSSRTSSGSIETKSQEVIHWNTPQIIIESTVG